MSEGSKKCSKRRKLESRPSKNPAPSKRRRRTQTKGASKETAIISEPDPIASIVTDPPMQFSIRIEVESCDEDWWHEEETREEEEVDCKDWKLKDTHEEPSTVSEQLLIKQDPSLEEYSRDSFEESHFKDICIKQEVPDPDKSQTLSEHLEIAIKEESNPSNDESSHNSVKETIETEKSNKLKFAYLEALHQNSALDKLEGSPNQLGRQSATELKNLECLGNELHGKVCIKQELPDEDLNGVGATENLTEYLGITIKEEPLKEAIYQEQDEADIKLGLKNEESTDEENCNDMDEEKGAHEGLSEIPNPLCQLNKYKYTTNFLALQYRGKLDPAYGSGIPSWHVHSRYFDIALDNALESSYHIDKIGLKFDCGLCGQTFQAADFRAIEACVQDIRTHLNYVHLDNTLVLRVLHRTDPCTILANKVSVSNRSKRHLIRSARAIRASLVGAGYTSSYLRYADTFTAALVDLQLTKSFLQNILGCLTKDRHKRALKILSYKCYTCKLCYEHLGHYVEHMKTMHAVRDYWRVIKFSTETVRGVFVNVKACEARQKFQDFPVIANETNGPVYKCLLCKADFGNKDTAYAKHRKTKPKCSGCGRLYFCHELHAHLGRCHSFYQKSYPKTCACKKIYQTASSLAYHQKSCVSGDKTLDFYCPVCSFISTTSHMLLQHQRYAHHVRSDEFVLSEHVIGGPGTNPSTKRCKSNCKQLHRVLKKEAEPTNMIVKSGQKTYPPKRMLLCNSLSTCTICSFKVSLSSETLAEHMVFCHRVRTDLKVVTCNWCSFSVYTDVSRGEVLLKEHTVRFHSIYYDLLKDRSCSIADVCLICYETFNEEFLVDHLQTYHKVRSNDHIEQDLSKCELCLTIYPGPPDSHYCPKRFDTVRCYYCTRQFRNNHFLSCHINGYQAESCTYCNVTLNKGCMRARHEASCRGDRMVVHECLKCGYKEDEWSAIEAHWMRCFTKAERAHRIYFSKELVVPKVGVSSNSKYDHSYVTLPISDDESPELTRENSNDSLISVSKVLCTEVYEETDSESAMVGAVNDDMDIAIPNVTTLQQEEHTNVATNTTDGTQNDAKELTLGDNTHETDVSRNDVEATVKVDDLEDIVYASPHAYIPEREVINISTNDTDAAFIPVKKRLLNASITEPEIYSLLTGESFKEDGDKIYEVPLVMKIKSEPMDEEEYVVTKTTEIDAELSIEDFIENNFVISETEVDGLEPEVIKILCDGVSKPKKRSKNKLLQIHTCVHCPYKGTHRNFQKHMKSCSSVGKTQVLLTSLPYNCLDHCCSFKCYNCLAEHPSLDEYHTHKCNRISCCPCCRTEYKNLAYLKGHLQSVIREQYGDVSEQTSGKSFICTQCKGQVATADIFNHWANHRAHGDVSLDKAEQTPLIIKQEYSDSVPETDDDPSQDDGVFRLQIDQDNDGSSLECLSLSQDVLNDILTTLKMRLKNRGVQTACKLCDKVCNRNQEYKIHLIQHLLSDAYSKKKVLGSLRCQICSQEFAKPPEYKTHMRNHADLPLYQCPRCDKTFSDCSNLAKHRKVHNMGVKICDLCQRKFNCKVMLAKHLEWHATSKPLLCGHCPATFLYKSDFRRHVNTRHRQQPQQFSCSACRVRLPTMKDKWDHEWEEHGVRKVVADCPVCGEKFRRLIDLKRHLRASHNFIQYSKSDLRLRTLLGELQKYGVEAERVDRVIAKTISGGSKTMSGGSKTMSSGSNTLSGGSKTNSDGFKILSGGSKAIGGGTKTMNGGSKTMSGGSKTMSGGSKTTGGGSKTKSGGSKTMSGGSKTKSDGSNTMSGGSKTMSVGFKIIGGGSKTIKIISGVSKSISGGSKTTGGGSKTKSGGSKTINILSRTCPVRSRIKETVRHSILKTQ